MGEDEQAATHADSSGRYLGRLLFEAQRAGEAAYWKALQAAVLRPWQPIATAPKGQTVIGYAVREPEKWLRVGLGVVCEDGGWLWLTDAWAGPATHWMPLPNPPLK